MEVRKKIARLATTATASNNEIFTFKKVQHSLESSGNYFLRIVQSHSSEYYGKKFKLNKYSETKQTVYCRSNYTLSECYHMLPSTIQILLYNLIYMLIKIRQSNHLDYISSFWTSAEMYSNTHLYLCKLICNILHFKSYLYSITQDY